MFSPRTGRGIGYVVCWGKGPRALFADEGEVFGMVILIIGHQVDYHPAEHFLYLDRVLSKIARQCKEVCVVNIHVPEICFQKGCGG